MDSEEFYRCLPTFNGLLIAHLASNAATFAIVNNYVKQKFSYTSLQSGENTIDFTVSYSEFYHVPVLHFRVDGGVDILKLPPDSRKYCVMDMHPILQQPYVTVHPCETETTMASLGVAGTEYLCSWFGIYIGLVFPDLQLRVPKN